MRATKSIHAMACAAACAAPFLFTVEARAANVVVFSPHEDDETIACAGIIRSSVLRGDAVTLVLATNGDYLEGATKARERLVMTLTSMGLLGLPEGSVLYFGYADASVLGSAYRYPGVVFESTDGFTSETYGFEDLGVPDYHYMLFGRHGRYERADLAEDFYQVLDRMRPDQIYVPSPMESHPDHSVTGLLAYEAILRIKRWSDYSPLVREYMIYRGGLPQAGVDPTVPVDNSMADMDSTPYAWDERESMPVPPEMTLPIADLSNLKAQALRAYAGYTGTQFDRFIRSDEVYWRRNMSNLAYTASVAVSSENAALGQVGASAVDGVILGAPYSNSAFSLESKEWATRGELSGAWIRLTWPQPQTVSSVVLRDRPNYDDRILAATLRFSDGSTVPVGPLPNFGSALRVSFPTRQITWVELTVDAATGYDTGLSELEVYSDTPTPPPAPLPPPESCVKVLDVTASSENRLLGQYAVNVVDGVVDGYPHDPTKEWASAGEQVGAWVRIMLEGPCRVSQLVLHDRPSPFVQIRAGKLFFSDGSSASVGRLPNDGSGLVVDFAPRTVSWVEFVATSVRGKDVGLSELELVPAP